MVLVATALACSCARRASPEQADLAITHVTVIDATGAAAQPDMTVLIAGERIAEIASSGVAVIPAGAKILDGSGKFLIPGLADMHVHLTGAGEPGGSRQFMIPLLLANGITSVRDMGGYLESLLPLRREIEEGKRLGPHIFFAGPYLDGSPPAFQPSLVVSNAVEASENVRQLLQRGVDFVKVQSRLNRTAYFGIAAAAKREHISFVGHVPDLVTAAEASAAGQKSIEHLTGVLRACSGDEPKLMREQASAATGAEKKVSSRQRQLDWDRELLTSFSEAQAQKLLAEFVANGTWQTPTLILLRQDAYPSANLANAPDSRMKYIPRSELERWKENATQNSAGVGAAEYALRQATMEKSLQIVGAMQKAGVKILAGTDTAAPYVIPGFSLHEELGLLVEAGLTPMQALQAATLRAAEFMGKQATQGTVEKGKFADLVLLNDDPQQDIHNTAHIALVIVRGKVLERQALDGLLLSAEKYAAQ